MRFSWIIRVGRKLRQCSQRRPREERATCSRKQRWELCDPELRNSGGPRSRERQEGRPESLPGEQASPHLGLDSGLRGLWNREGMNVSVSRVACSAWSQQPQEATVHTQLHKWVPVAGDAAGKNSQG